MTSDPPRLLEATGDPSLRALLDAGRSELPPHARLESIHAKLLAATTGGASAATAAAKMTASTLKLKIFLGALVVVAVALGFVAGGASRGTRTTAPIVVTVTSPATTASPTPTSSTSAVPAPPQLASSSASTTSTISVPAAPKSSASIPSEVDLIRRAQAAVASDPTAALRLADEHRRLYPGGGLAQEREVIAIDALTRLGRTTEARARAKRFVAAWPDSTHLARLEKILGAPP